MFYLITDHPTEKMPQQRGVQLLVSGGSLGISSKINSCNVQWYWTVEKKMSQSVAQSDYKQTTKSCSSLLFYLCLLPVLRLMHCLDILRSNLVCYHSVTQKHKNVSIICCGKKSCSFRSIAPTTSSVQPCV